MYIINLIYLFLKIENKKIKIVLFCYLLVLTSVFWNENSRSFYIKKKIDTNHKYLAKTESQKPKYFFDKSWFSKDNKSVRMKYYIITLENLKKNFLFGTGIGTVMSEKKIIDKNSNSEIDDKKNPDPHSTWLLLLYETGVIGFFMYLFIVCKNKFIFFKKNIKFKINFFYFFGITFILSLFINIITVPVIWYLYSMRLNLNNNESKIN